MELGETTIEAARRETMEEANARVEIQNLYVLINLPHVDQVFMMFRARLLDLDFSPGPESTEVKLFEQNEIPWNELAFRTIEQTLKFYLSDLTAGQFPLRVGDLVKENNTYTFRPGPAVEN